jgi:hypothetical protein
MVKKSFSLFLVGMFLAMLVIPAPALAQGTGVGAGLTVPVQGLARGGGRVTGTFTILKFVSTGDANNPVGALGTLVLTTANGRTAVTQAVMPVQVSSAAAGTGGGTISAQQLTCEILNLTLGPLDLNLLGLVIHLDQVHLTIDANPAGGLLGQLLCAVANLLGPGGLIADLTAFLTALNALLAALGGLGL